MARETRWIAQYADGRIIREFEPRNGKWIETPFDTLDLSKVISFGLEGSGIRVGFRADDGVIGINGEGMEIALEDIYGMIFPITQRRDVIYNRIIQYKEAYSSIGSNSRISNGIEAYNIGWEARTRNDLIGELYAKLIARVGTKDNDPVSIYLYLQCANGFVGKLRYRYGGKEREPVKTVLRPGTLNKMAFHVSI